MSIVALYALLPLQEVCLCVLSLFIFGLYLGPQTLLPLDPKGYYPWAWELLLDDLLRDYGCTSP